MSKMTIEIDGQNYDGFKSATASSSMEEVSGTFSFSVSALNNLEKFPIKNGSKCRILVDDRSVINGYVENIEINYSVDSHEITVSGRDKTCDIIDSTLGDRMVFNGGINLVDVGKKVLSHLGITDIKVYSNITIAPFLSTEIANISSEVGETAFNFIEKYAKKRSVLVTTDGEGNLLFAQTSTNQIKTVLSSTYNQQSSIISAGVTYDTTKRFYKYLLYSQVSSQQNMDSVFDETPSVESDVTLRGDPAYDLGVRKTRTLTLLQGEAAYNSTKDLQNRAVYEANYRRSRGFKYTVTVQGFSPINDSGTIWKTNTLVKVIDEYCDIPGINLLVRSVKYDYSLTGGSTTTLELIDKESFTPDVLQGIKYQTYKTIDKPGTKIEAILK